MNRFSNPVHPRCLAVALLGLVAFVGCGKKLPPPSTPETARETLTSALDTWSRGEPPSTLAGATPPVMVLDREWEEGYTLERYALEGDGYTLGLGVQQAVALELKSPQGKSLKKTVNYVVNAGNPLVVARQDIDD